MTGIAIEEFVTDLDNLAIKLITEGFHGPAIDVLQAACALAMLPAEPPYAEKAK